MSLFSHFASGKELLAGMKDVHIGMRKTHRLRPQRRQTLALLPRN
jgi:hypothetical protein